MEKLKNKFIELGEMLSFTDAFGSDHNERSKMNKLFKEIQTPIIQSISSGANNTIEKLTQEKKDYERLSDSEVDRCEAFRLQGLADGLELAIEIIEKLK